jgi:hypothetical protein
MFVDDIILPFVSVMYLTRTPFSIFYLHANFIIVLPCCAVIFLSNSNSQSPNLEQQIDGSLYLSYNMGMGHGTHLSKN